MVHAANVYVKMSCIFRTHTHTHVKQIALRALQILFNRIAITQIILGLDATHNICI